MHRKIPIKWGNITQHGPHFGGIVPGKLWIVPAVERELLGGCIPILILPWSSGFPF
jgi:hypothetical protein